MTSLASCSPRASPVDERLPLGVMIEVPSAVLVAAELAREVDFLSLGTNDLAQYLLAADRDDAAMSGYYRMLHPAVLRAIRTGIRAGEHAQKGVMICGEMAGDPYYTELLVGLGLRRFSVAPRQIGELRHEIRLVDPAAPEPSRNASCAARPATRSVASSIAAAPAATMEGGRQRGAVGPLHGQVGESPAR